jgi:hypothetical protein
MKAESVSVARGLMFIGSSAFGSVDLGVSSIQLWGLVPAVGRAAADA